MISIASTAGAEAITSQVGTKTARARRATPADRRCERTRDVLDREIGFIANRSFAGKSSDFGANHPIINAVESGNGGELAALRTHNLPSHLVRLCATPILTAQQEQVLFRRMNFLKYRANCLRSSLNASRPDPSRLDEIDDLLNRAQRIRDHIIQSNIRLVISIAKKFTDAKYVFDEMLSDGIASVMHAVEKFDYDRGFRFSTYATRAIRRDLYRNVMKRQQERQRTVSGAEEFLEDGGPQPARSSEMSLGTNNLYKSLDELVGQLDPREQVIIRARFGFDAEGGRKTTYVALGKQLGISKERVRQIAERAIEKLRRPAAAVGLDAQIV